MRVWTGALAVLLATAGGAAAQKVGPNGRTVYEAAFFSQFAPANALEIVRRVPGFTLDQVDVEVRGFGVAAGNVVINGQRPSSKSDTLETILARIPAARVLRIEVGAGALFGSEYAGKAQVVNLVMDDVGGVSGTVTATVRRIFDGRLLPEGNVSTLVRSGASTFNVAMGVNNNRISEIGFDRAVALPSRALIEYRRKYNHVDAPNAYVSGSWDRRDGTYETARLNARVAMDRFALTQSSDVVTGAGAARQDGVTQRFNFNEYEVGGDVMRPLAGGGIRLIGLATRRDRHNRERSVLGSPIIGGGEQALRSQRDEAVLRLLWNRSDLAGWSVEAGGEGAFNRLRSKVDLLAFAPGGVVSPVDLPVDDATVKEVRGELFVNAGRALDPTLRLDLGITYERSRLTVTGDADADRTLGFLKPRASLDWRPGNGWRLQGSLTRTVAQLQFEDFISAAELTNERVNGGNPDLVPQRAWEALLTIERPILGDGLLKAELGYNRVSQVQDRVPTPEGFDAPGNLGDGTERIARLTFDVPVGRLGLTGGRLSGRLSYVGSSVRDPYTLEDRRFSNSSAFVYAVNWRQDLGAFAWGVGFEGSSRNATYRRDEVDSFLSANPWITAFAEYRVTPRTIVTFSANNLGDLAARRERIFYRPDRRTMSPSGREVRSRDQHIIPFLTVKHNFG